MKDGVIVLNCWMSVPALAIVIGCLAALLRLTGEQWRWSRASAAPIWLWAGS